MPMVEFALSQIQDMSVLVRMGSLVMTVHKRAEKPALLILVSMEALVFLTGQERGTDVSVWLELLERIVKLIIGTSVFISHAGTMVIA